MMMKSKGKIIAYSNPLEQQANNLTFERGTIKMNEKKDSNEVDQPLQDEFNKKGMDRRSCKRINLSAPIWFQVLNPGQGASMPRPVAGELWDISKSGLSFYFQSKSREAVRRLVGRNVGVRFKLNVDGKVKEVALTGIVQGVQDHPLDEYSVHLMLRKQFSDEAIKTIHRVAETL